MFSFFKKPLLKEILIISIVIAVLHYLALIYFLYWNIWWFDIPMHFIGGLLIGLISIFLFYTSKYMDFPKDHIGSIFAMTLGSVLLVGLVWELWELFVGFTDVVKDGGDTFIDLVMDTLGGITAFIYGKKFVWMEK